MTKTNKSQIEREKKGMSREEIYEKISVLKTNKSKINYLKPLERRIGLTTLTTQKSFYNVLGNLYENIGEVGWAEKYYLDAKSKGFYGRLGQKAFEMGDFSTSFRYYQKVGDIEGSKMAASEGLKSGRSFTMIGNEDPSKKFSPDTLARFGEFFRTIGETEKSKESFDKAGDMALYHCPFLHLEGLFYSENPSLAVKYYKKAGKNEKVKNVWVDQAEISKREKRLIDAAKFYKKAGLEEKVRECYLKEGDSDLFEAEKWYEKANASNDEWMNLAYRTLEKGRLKDAINWFKNGNARKEDFILAGDRLIRRIYNISLKKKEIKESFKKIEELYKIGEATGEKWIELGKEEQWFGYHDLAANNYIHNFSIEKVIEMGDSLAEKGRFKDALIYYEKARINESENIRDLNKVLKIYEEVGLGSEAMKLTKKIKRLHSKK